jgi:hypothetical protein
MIDEPRGAQLGPSDVGPEWAAALSVTLQHLCGVQLADAVQEKGAAEATPVVDPMLK